MEAGDVASKVFRRFVIVSGDNPSSGLKGGTAGAPSGISNEWEDCCLVFCAGGKCCLAVDGDGAGNTVADCCATKSNALGMSNVSRDAGDRSIDRSEGSRKSPKSWRPRLPMLSFIKSSSWPKELLKSKDSSPRPKRFACVCVASVA